MAGRSTWVFPVLVTKPDWIGEPLWVNRVRDALEARWEACLASIPRDIRHYRGLATAEITPGDPHLPKVQVCLPEFVLLLAALLTGLEWQIIASTRSHGGSGSGVCKKLRLWSLLGMKRAKKCFSLASYLSRALSSRWRLRFAHPAEPKSSSSRRLQSWRCVSTANLH